MANDLNQCQFIGRLGKDVDMRYMPSGDAIASFSIAVGSQWKDKEGAKQEATEWVNVTAFGKLAEICGQYLSKGSQVFVSGRMKTDKYQDKETGQDRYSTKIIADKMQMLGSKPESAPARQSAPQSSGSSGFDDFLDDVPF
jgi:single-strand DNA-binding protein